MDNQATTPVDPRVFEAMLPYFTENFGNASSVINRHGQTAREAVENGRKQTALTAGVEPDEVIFTSGATESINTVLQGVVRGRTWSDVHIITCATEHSAVLDTCTAIERFGAKVSRLSVNSDGHLDLSQLDTILQSGATLVSLMHANNETGVIHPIEKIAQLCQEAKVPLHVDAAQTFGKIPIAFRDWKIDFMSISGHKIYAPKGIGALFIRRQVPPLRLNPLLHGGSQEHGIRSGTINVPGVVGLGRAAKIAASEMQSEQLRIAAQRDTLLKLIKAELPDAIINGCMKHRLAGNLNLSFPGLEANRLLPALQDQLSISSGSACQSGNNSPSHVLTALGTSDELAMSSLRFGLGRFTTDDEVNFAAKAVVKAVTENSSARDQ